MVLCITRVVRHKLMALLVARAEEANHPTIDLSGTLHSKLGAWAI